MSLLHAVGFTGAFLGGLLLCVLLRRYTRIRLTNITGIFRPAANAKPYGPWSIGIYEGTSPFDLAPCLGVPNPILTGEDVTDCDACFVADPFWVMHGRKFYLFFEVLVRQPRRGAIGYAESCDGKTWEYRQIVIKEGFHLSYPYVFEWQGAYYLIPESAEDFSVRLYKASRFPDKWDYVGNLLSGYRYLDASILRHQDKWWMFVATGSSNVLNLYYSSDLLQGWQAHPMNPIVKLNAHIARPGGRVVAFNEKIYRFAQDDDPRYGTQVWAIEISELSEGGYQEKPLLESPVIKGAGFGWNSEGMHTVDAQAVGRSWIAVVDGRDGPP